MRNGHTTVERNFILQQGFDDPDRESCGLRYSALMFQPRVILGVVLVGILLQSAVLFLALSAVLWWSALPRWHPFDAVYDATFGKKPGALRMEFAVRTLPWGRREVG